MPGLSESRDETGYQCIDCGISVPLPELIEERPSEFLIVRGGLRTERIVTVAGTIVHRCESPFLIPTF